jgi:hypothetical protein
LYLPCERGVRGPLHIWHFSSGAELSKHPSEHLPRPPPSGRASSLFLDELPCLRYAQEITVLPLSLPVPSRSRRGSIQATPADAAGRRFSSLMIRFNSEASTPHRGHRSNSRRGKGKPSW